MKNFIKYYYNLDVSNIIQKENNYHLKIDNENYLFCICNEHELKEMMKYLFNDYNFHTIILTINNGITVTYNDKEYVLLKLKMPYRNIRLDDINNFNYPVGVSNEISRKWVDLWASHIDYIEYQIHELNNKYPIISKYIYYYIGLAENAIQLLNTLNMKSNYSYIAHKRINVDATLVDLYNPTLIIVDSKVRDISEYFKSMFFKCDVNIDNILNDIYLSIKNYDEYELNLFFARMLYPTYFFDVYDQVIEYNLDEEEIMNIINKSYDYEILLKKLYLSIKKATHIENIEWLSQ